MNKNTSNFRDHAVKIRKNTRKLLYPTLTFLGLITLNPAWAADPLPKLKIDPIITISGLSSGGYMANQFHMAHAENVSGVGIIGAGPYFCSEGSLDIAQKQCLDKDTVPPVDKLVKIAKDRSAAKQIANVAELKNDAIWVLHGTQDHLVAEPVTHALVDFYKAFVPDNKIVYKNDLAVGHGFPTVKEGAECAHTEPPYINHCQYDAAGEMLKHFYGTLTEPKDEMPTTGKLTTFDQTKYNLDKSGLARIGYIYIPDSCKAGAQCKLHVSFHGCKQNAKMVGDLYIKETGLNRWAEVNNMVILYPQTNVALPANPYGCWDWWGYTNEHFAERDGVQIESVWRMVKALRGVK